MLTWCKMAPAHESHLLREESLMPGHVASARACGKSTGVMRLDEEFHAWLCMLCLLSKVKISIF